MTYSEYRNTDVPLDDLKLFFAHSDEQFNDNLKKLNAKHETCLEAGDLCRAPWGMAGIEADIEEFYRRSAEKTRKIKELYSPQEVYDYEYGNYECEYVGSDEDAIKIAVELFGAEQALTVKRKNAGALIGFIAPNFEELFNQKWDEIKKKEISDGVELMSGVKKWLRGFLTDDIKARLTAYGKSCIDDNWEFWVERSSEPMTEFSNYGEKFVIYKETDKHQYCEASFFVYWLAHEGNDDGEKYTSNIKLLSYGKQI